MLRRRDVVASPLERRLDSRPGGSSPSPARRHGRACPGHPRRTVPRSAPKGCCPPRGRSGHGTAWVPGTGPGMTREGVRTTAEAAAEPPRSGKPTAPSAPAPAGSTGRPSFHRRSPRCSDVEASRYRRLAAGAPARQSARRLVPLTGPPSWPGLSRPPTPHRTAKRTEGLRGRSGHGTAWVPGTGSGMTREGVRTTAEAAAEPPRSGKPTAPSAPSPSGSTRVRPAVVPSPISAMQRCRGVAMSSPRRWSAGSTVGPEARPPHRPAVMAGLVPATHAAPCRRAHGGLRPSPRPVRPRHGVGARDRSGHDAGRA